MRILILTNFYPPHELGGQGRSCKQVVEGLEQRGHETLVLTSMHGTDNVPDVARKVHRKLYLEMDLIPLRHSITFFMRRKAREQHNLECLHQLLQQFQPDLVFVWGMWNLPRSVPAFAEAWNVDKVVYRFAEYWPTLPSQHEFYWRAPGRTWYGRMLKRILGPLAMAMLAREKTRYHLEFKNAYCVSAATRDVLVEAGIPVSHAQVIYTGLDLQPYGNGRQRRQRQDLRLLKLLYAGRLTPEKGIETAIEAMGHLVDDQDRAHVVLSIAGSGQVEYENRLHALVAQANLEKNVTFLGLVPGDEMPALMRRHDVLLVPSIWPEPFARTVLEGMISGLVVVASATGGTVEAISDGENGLLFAPDQSEALAEEIARLAGEPALRGRLARAGRKTVMARFTVKRMMDEIEHFLQTVATQSSAAAALPEKQRGGVANAQRGMELPKP